MIPKEIYERLDAELDKIEKEIKRDHKITVSVSLMAIFLTGTMSIYNIFNNYHYKAIVMIIFGITNICVLQEHLYWYKGFKRKSETLKQIRENHKTD